MKLAVVDSDLGRRASLVAHLRSQGFAVQGCAVAADIEPGGVDIAMVAGADLIGACGWLRRRRRVRWIVAIAPPGAVAQALAAGANDCVFESAGPAELELRLAVARAGGGLEPELAPLGEEPSDPLDQALPRITGAQLRTILDSLPMPVGVVSGSGVFLQCNRELERTFRCEPGGVAGRKLTDFLANADAWQMFERIKIRGRVRDHELQILHPDGTSHWVAGQAQWLPGSLAGELIW